MDGKANITYETVVVSKRLQEIMQERGLSQRALAEMTGISPSLVASIMNNTRNVTLGVLKKLALALNISADELLGISWSSKDSLDELVKRKEEIEQKIENILILASKASMEEKGRLLNRVQKLYKEAEQVTALIKRITQNLSEQEKQKSKEHRDVPLVNERGAKVCIPAVDDAGDVSCAVRLKNGTLLYLNTDTDKKKTGLYAVKDGSNVQIVKETRPNDVVLGEVVYVLTPPHRSLDTLVAS